MKKINLDTRVKNALKEVEKIYKKYQIVSRPLIFFPKCQKVPKISQLALWIVKKQGGILDTQFINTKK